MCSVPFCDRTTNYFAIMGKLIAAVYKEQHLQGSLPTVALEEQVQAIEETCALNQKIEDVFENADTAHAMTKALEDLAFVVDNIREVTPKEAALIQIAGDMSVAGANVPAEHVTPSMESILDGKITAREIAAKIKDTVEHIIAAIRALLRKVSTYVQSYISRATVVAGGSETRLKKLEEAYRNIHGTSPTRKSFEMVLPTVGGRATNTMDELLDSSKDFLHALDAFTRVAGDANYNFGSGFVALYETNLGKNEESDQATRHTAVLSAMKRISRSFDVGHAFHRYRDLTGDDGTVITDTPSLIGGVKITVSSMPESVFDSSTLHSSVSIRELLGKVARKNGINVQLEEGATTAKVEVEAMTDSQIRKAIELTKQLLTHYSGRSGSTSLTSAMKKRNDFARQCSDTIMNRVKEMNQEIPLAYSLSVEALGVTEAITRNSTIAYSRLSENTGRLISYLLTAISKSIRAHAEDEEKLESEKEKK